MTGDFAFLACPARDDPLSFAALQARGFALWRSLGRLRGVRFRLPGEGQRGSVRGCAPPRPPLHSPGTPPKKGFQLPESGEGTRLVLRELPSLATLAQVISLRDA